MYLYMHANLQCKLSVLLASTCYNYFLFLFFIVWQPRRAADTSTNWRQSLFCCCTASME